MRHKGKRGIKKQASKQTNRKQCCLPFLPVIFAKILLIYLFLPFSILQAFQTTFLTLIICACQSVLSNSSASPHGYFTSNYNFFYIKIKCATLGALK